MSPTVKWLCIAAIGGAVLWWFFVRKAAGAAGAPAGIAAAGDSSAWTGGASTPTASVNPWAPYVVSREESAAAAVSLAKPPPVIFKPSVGIGWQPTRPSVLFNAAPAAPATPPAATFTRPPALRVW